MAEFTDPALRMRLGDGRVFEAFTAYSLASDYLTPTDGWEVTLVDEDASKLRELELQEAELFIDGASQVIGRVDVTERGGAEGTAVVLRGRDYLADLVECHVDPTLKVKAGETVGAVILNAARPVGIDGIVDDSTVSMRQIRAGRSIAAKKKGSKKDAVLEEYKPAPREGLFAFIARIVARYGQTIQPAASRADLHIGAPNYEQTPVATLARSLVAPASANVILRASATRDYSSFPTYVLVAGQSAAVGKRKVVLNKAASSRSVVSRIGGEVKTILDRVADYERRRPGELPQGLYRLFSARDTDSRTQEQIDAVATRAFAEQFKQTLIYRVELRGHADPESGALWAVDTMITVRDEICDVNEALWVASRTFKYASGSGATTELECWRPGAFQIDEA